MWNGKNCFPIYRCPIQIGCVKILKRAYWAVMLSAPIIRATHTKVLAIIDVRPCFSVATSQIARKPHQPILIEFCSHFENTCVFFSNQNQLISNVQTIQFTRCVGEGKVCGRKPVCGGWCTRRSKHYADGTGKLYSTILSWRKRRVLWYVRIRSELTIRINCFLYTVHFLFFFSPFAANRVNAINTNRFKPPVSEMVKDIVRKNFTREIEFYEFCRQRLYKQYAALNLVWYGVCVRTRACNETESGRWNGGTATKVIIKKKQTRRENIELAHFNKTLTRPQWTVACAWVKKRMQPPRICTHFHIFVRNSAIEQTMCESLDTHTHMNFFFISHFFALCI